MNIRNHILFPILFFKICVYLGFTISITNLVRIHFEKNKDIRPLDLDGIDSLHIFNRSREKMPKVTIQFDSSQTNKHKPI